MSGMQELHLESLDLNLVVALDALLEEKNVTRAAERVGITQSAMSHALGRLRELTGDALLVRSGGGMVATARAEALGPPIRRALDEIEGALRSPAAFDPATARRKIRISTSDFGEIVLLPRFVARLRKEAPGMDLRVTSFTDDAPGVLGGGHTDVVIAPLRPRDGAANLRARKLFDESFVCLVRRNHPLTRKPLTLERFAAADHALIAPRGKEGSFVDDALGRVGLSRRVVVTVPHFLVAPHLIAGSELVLTLPAPVAAILAEPLGLTVIRPPKELPLEGFTMSAIWHERTQDDPALAWVRQVLADVAGEI